MFDSFVNDFFFMNEVREWVSLIWKNCFANDFSKLECDFIHFFVYESLMNDEEVVWSESIANDLFIKVENDSFDE